MAEAVFSGLCIGGVLDGKTLEHYAPTFQAPEPSKPFLGVSSSAMANAVTFRVTNYEFEEFRVRDRGDETVQHFGFWRPHDMKTSEMLDLLVTSYEVYNGHKDEDD